MYAETCFKEFGDRVKHWITFNEPHTFAVQGYDVGLHAPSRCFIILRAFCRAGNSAAEPYIVSHNVLLSHSSVVQIYKKKYKEPTRNFFAAGSSRIGLSKKTSMVGSNEDFLQIKDRLTGSSSKLETISIVGMGGIGGGGGMAVSEKSLFTASQLHELERQQIIHKYMMASIPVPHELMLPFSRTSSSLAGAPQSKMCVASGSGVDSRFSSSKLDPEPWRCRRTDGKKWRCSRNAAADQRYCERHSRKNKPIEKI